MSNGLGWILSVLFAFITNRKYVFSSESKNTKDKLKEFFLFVSARVLSYFLFDVLGYNLCIYALNLGHSFVKIFMNVLVVVFNYFASRFIVFSKEIKKPCIAAYTTHGLFFMVLFRHLFFNCRLCCRKAGNRHTEG